MYTANHNTVIRLHDQTIYIYIYSWTRILQIHVSNILTPGSKTNHVPKCFEARDFTYFVTLYTVF